MSELAVWGWLRYFLFSSASNIRSSLCKFHEMLMKLDHCTAKGSAFGNTGLIVHPLTFFVLRLKSCQSMLFNFRYGPRDLEWLHCEGYSGEFLFEWLSVAVWFFLNLHSTAQARCMALLIPELPSYWRSSSDHRMWLPTPAYFLTRLHFSGILLFLFQSLNTHSPPLEMSDVGWKCSHTLWVTQWWNCLTQFSEHIILTKQSKPAI